GRLLGGDRARRRRRQPLSRGFPAARLRGRHRRGGRAALLRARALLLSKVPERLGGLCRGAGLPHDQDAADRDQAAGGRPGAEDPPVPRLEAVPRPGLRHRRQPGHRAAAAHGVHPLAARRPSHGAAPDRLDAEGPHAPQPRPVRARGAAARPRHVARLQGPLVAVFPERVGRLVLVSPLELWRDDAPSADLLILPQDDLPAVLFRDPGSEAARRWAAKPAGEHEELQAYIESIQRRAAMAKFVWPLPDKGIKKRLHRITAPTLLLWGDADRANPIVYAEEWQRRIKGAAVRLLVGGHMLLHEAPEAAAAAVVEFVDR